MNQTGEHLKKRILAVDDDVIIFSDFLNPAK